MYFLFISTLINKKLQQLLSKIKVKKASQHQNSKDIINISDMDMYVCEFCCN